MDVCKDAILTITKVDASANLQIANVYVSAIIKEKEQSVFEELRKIPVICNICSTASSACGLCQRLYLSLTPLSKKKTSCMKYCRILKKIRTSSNNKIYKSLWNIYNNRRNWPRGEVANTTVCKTVIRGCKSHRGLKNRMVHV